jgi:hypothetical protein
MYIFRLILVLLLFLFVSVGANAQCSYSNPTECGSPGVNNIAIGGVINGGNGSSVRVTPAGGGSAQTLGTWAGYLAGQPNPNPLIMQGQSSSAITTDQAQLTSQLNNPTLTANYILGCAIGACGQSVYAADAIRGVATQISGSTDITVSGIGAYVLNNNAGGVATQAANGLWAVNICAVNNCQSWGGAVIVADSEGFTGITAGTGRQLYGLEADCNTSSPSTICIGFFAGGTAFSDSTYLVGFQTNSLAGGAGAKWAYSFVSPDGNATSAILVGATAKSGSSLYSQPIIFDIFDSGGTERTPELYGNPTNGLTTTAMNFEPATTGTSNLGGSSLYWENLYVDTIWAGGTEGATCPTGLPTSSFATYGGTVIHC